MDKQGIENFLEGTKMAVMATINKDGTPQLSPNWYHYDGSQLSFVTTKVRLKFLNLKRDDRISVCIYEPPLAPDYVVFQGRVTLDDGDIWDDSRKVIRRYIDADGVEEVIERWKTQPRVLVKLTPDKIYSRF